MRINKFPAFFLLFLSYSVNVQAAPGWVSRSCAPVGAQESITVDWTYQSNRYWTSSNHYRGGVLLHSLWSGWQVTWRSYAGHFGSEFWYGTVVGYHWTADYSKVRMLGVSQAVDCNLSHWGF